jgi:hypothetical protein
VSQIRSCIVVAGFDRSVVQRGVVLFFAAGFRVRHRFV